MLSLLLGQSLRFASNLPSSQPAGVCHYLTFALCAHASDERDAAACGSIDFKFVATRQAMNPALMSVQAPENVLLRGNYFRSNLGSNLGGAVSFAGGAAKGSLSSNLTAIDNIYTANEVCPVSRAAHTDAPSVAQASDS